MNRICISNCQTISPAPLAPSRHMSLTFSLLLLPLAMFFLGVLPSDAHAGVEKCLPDVERFCQGVQPGEGRIEACLKGNEKKISAVCKRSLREHHEGIQNFFVECQEDARNYCRGMRGGATIQECLTKNKRKLSNACRKSLRKAPKLQD